MTDAIVVGAGPNGLAAAVLLARAGLGVHLIEAADTLGGGLRTSELTLPGFLHDECSAVHPLALASPFFRAFELGRRIDLVVPEVSYAHPLDGAPAALALRSLEQTAHRLDAHRAGDGRAWQNLLGPLVARAEGIARATLDQLLQLPRDPAAAALFGLATLEQGTPLRTRRLVGPAPAALLAGVTAHIPGPQPSLMTAGGGLALAVTGHTGGWPVAVGGSASIARALAEDAVAHGVTIETGRRVRHLDELADADAVILDVSPEQFRDLAGGQLPLRYRRTLARYRRGVAACKVDFALSGPVPWSDPELHRTATVHLGGTREQIARAEGEAAAGRHPEHPYVLVTQPTAYDPSRAPAGKHTLWAYTHVPNGSALDVSGRIIEQIERFAPGFREVILATSVRTGRDLAAHNLNYAGGDFMGGEVSLTQMLRRPVLSPVPWATPLPRVFLGSASTPPGPAVHGLGGYYAARTALSRVFGIHSLPYLGVRG
ncbi:phytoene dehydrogenase-like protein [Klugiella xanthotipulae]|uniref:Phytoene dehydrogenase-like protein n=1 Tax=Klugiella xanthotipulae TaxID=244735 RepID=A0A543I543_9MICO|nr:NAD(P)/FAD-dependent oxidoreductase [Klugiella xanthotipulae]TQM65590.1 phytoene dehydrogenase-like protein [Klugiella xanthotipulae]